MLMRRCTSVTGNSVVRYHGAQYIAGEIAGLPFVLLFRLMI